PLLLYPLLGMSVFQVQQFLKEHPSKVRIIGTAALPGKPGLFWEGKAPPPFLGRDGSLLELELISSTTKTHAELQADAQRDIRLGLCDVVVAFPADFAERLAALQGREFHNEEVPHPPIYFDLANDKSKVAWQRIESVLYAWRDALGKNNLEASKVSVAAVRPFELQQTDIAEEGRRRAALWSKLLPFVLMI